jgi:hypothetical protein
MARQRTARKRQPEPTSASQATETPEGGESQVADEKVKTPRPTYTPVLQEIDVESIPTQKREGPATKTLNEFLASGMQAAEVTNGAKAYGASLRRVIKDKGLVDQVTARTIGGRTILQRVA